MNSITTTIVAAEVVVVAGFVAEVEVVVVAVELIEGLIDSVVMTYLS